jgi:transposase
VSECALAERHEIIRRSAAEAAAPAIAAALGRSVRTVTRWRSAFRRAGEAGLAYRRRRPHTRLAHTTPPPVVARIAAIRTEHPGWGARLIHRQLRLEGSQPVPGERTVQSGLGRLGCPPVRPPAPKPLGFPQPPAGRDDTLWEVDHKKKGGTGT